jgi:predicted lipid-binding transport protein (Tim44 family)
MAAIALLPALAGCSSSSSVEYVADAYPSRSLADLLKGSMESAPPAQRPEPAPSAAMAASPAPASSGAPAPTPATIAAPPAASPAAQAPPPTPAPAAAADEPDPVAAAYPSVSLIDLLTGRKPAQ